MPELRYITDPNLPEPKGASTATSGQVYVADGAGSGNWVMATTGWGYYDDNATEQTFGTSASKLAVNGSGTGTNTDHLPLDIRGSGDLWNSLSGKVTPQTVGDAFDIVLELPITTETTSPGEIEVSLDVGGLASPSAVVAVKRITPLGSTPYTCYVNFSVAAMTQAYINNGIQVFIGTDTGSVGITAPKVYVKKTHDGNV